MSDFYIGYLPKPPQRLAQFLRPRVALLGLLAVGIGLLLALGQMPFAASSFEYGKLSSLEGTIEAQPYPRFLVARPGKTGDLTAYSGYLLVAPGKHGADHLVAEFDGQAVRLQGQLIYRGGRAMVEIQPGAIVPTGTTPVEEGTTTDLGPIAVTGEIVDSKCYLGVMNPGNGKVHRDCAARCLSGGIPPIFVTSDRGEQYLLIGLDGRSLQRDVLREFVAEPMTLRGEALQRGDTRFLAIDPRTLRHAPGRIQQWLGSTQPQNQGDFNPEAGYPAPPERTPGRRQVRPPCHA
jgi:hypothetical protein